MVYNFVLKADSLSLYFTKKIVISNIAEQKYSIKIPNTVTKFFIKTN